MRSNNANCLNDMIMNHEPWAMTMTVTISYQIVISISEDHSKFGI